MAKIFISGLLNIETSLRVDSFPIVYSPIEYPFFGVNSSVSGVGFNLAKAIKTLGGEPILFSLLGEDECGTRVRSALTNEEIKMDAILSLPDMATPESVVIFDKEGRRKVYCDLKDIQDRDACINGETLPAILKGCELAMLTNINFSRPFLKSCKGMGIRIATDVHVLSDVNDPYNKDFIANADYLFLSNEGVKGKEGEFIKELYSSFHNKIIVMGCGEEGALAYVGETDAFFYEKAVAPKGIINTVGAGDALFSSFLFAFLKTEDVGYSLRFAVTFAGIKIATSGGANGFPSEKEVESFL